MGLSMQAMAARYTEITYEESERVQNQIAKVLPTGRVVEFDHQGSVTNDTHIKTHSDIDLLVLVTWFNDLLPPLTATTPYQGDPTQDLLWLRETCHAHLSAAFGAATVDGSGSKALSISGGEAGGPTRSVMPVSDSWTCFVALS